MLMAIYTALAGLAVWRMRDDRFGVLPASALFASLMAALALPYILDKPALAAGLALIEALLAMFLMSCVVNWRLRSGGAWCECSVRAMLLGMICLGKIMLWTLYTGAIQDARYWNEIATAINAGFVLQVVIAGGFGDGLAGRVYDLWHRWSGRGARSLARDGGAR